LAFLFGAATEAGPSITASVTSSTAVWYHCVLTRSGSTLRMFINGSLVGTSSFGGIGRTLTINTSLGAYYSSPGNIGATGAAYYTGFTDDVRITPGVARYITNFTPPIFPHPNQ